MLRSAYGETWSRDLAGGGMSTGGQGVGCPVSNLGGEFGILLISTGVCVSGASGGGGGNGTFQLFYSQRSLPMIPAPPARALRLVKSSFHIPQAFSRLLLLCSISAGLFLWSFRAWTVSSHFPGSPREEPADF